jgi:alpha-N-arabinofuranosidase
MKRQIGHLFFCFFILFTTLFSCKEAGSRSFSNGGFESGLKGTWKPMREEFGSATIERESDVSPNHLLLITSSEKGSDGENSFILFQELSVDEYRGRTVSFGGQLKTRKAVAHLLLWTDKASKSIIEKNSDSGKLSRYEETLDIPENISTIRLAIQIFAPPGGKIWADDLFVNVLAARDGGNRTSVSDAKVNGTITFSIDPSKPKKKVNPLVFGGNVEWIDNAQGLWNPKKYSLDSLFSPMIQELRTPILRFPGGTLSDYYKWKDGVGPTDKRKPGFNVFEKKYEPMNFGTDEMIAFADLLDSSILLTVNAGTGSPDDAEEWVRYLQKKGRTPQYVEVGNEIYMAKPQSDDPNGKHIFHKAEGYADKLISISDKLKRIDPSIKIGAIGGLDTGNYDIVYDKKWIKKIFSSAGDKIDFLALHNAYAPVIFTEYDYYNKNKLQEAYKSLYAGVNFFEDNLKKIGEEISTVSKRHGDSSKFAITEHMSYFSDQSKEAVDQTRTLAAGLYTASLLQSFVRNDRILMANYMGFTHKYFGMMITKTEQGLVRTPTYYVYRMYREMLDDYLIDCVVSGSGHFSSKSVGIVPANSRVAFVDTLATLNKKTGRVALYVINKSFDTAMKVKVNFVDKSRKATKIEVLTASSANAINGPSLSGSVVPHPLDTIRNRSVPIDPDSASGLFTFPPSSFTVIYFDI